MTGTLVALLAAMVLFVATHLIGSSLPVRTRLIAALGETGFRACYSIIALALLIWVIIAHIDAPVVAVWSPPLGLQHLALSLMSLACLLLVAGYSTRNPTAVGVDTAAVVSAEPLGIFRVTRHPIMWAIALWGIAHLLANGAAADMVLFGGLSVLALAGAAHSDARRQATVGAPWAAYRERTSFVPMAAILARRTSFKFGEIGWGRLLGALALFAILLVAHPWLFGVSPLPGVF